MNSVMTFEQWMHVVNMRVEGLVGLSADDLPDMDFYRMYQKGQPPISAARAIIRNAKEN